MNHYDLRRFCFSEGEPACNGAATVCELPLWHEGECCHVREDLLLEPEMGLSERGGMFVGEVA